MMKNYIPCFFFFNFLNHIQYLLKQALIHLGLLEPPPVEPDHHSADGYVFVTDGRSGSIVLVPVQVLMAMIKTNLPVLEYGEFVERFGDHEDDDDDDEQMKKERRVCTVCLDPMEKIDEMRELCMCCHVFHKECIDTWVDEGRVTCPLCRSTLYPVPMDWPARP